MLFVAAFTLGGGWFIGELFISIVQSATTYNREDGTFTVNHKTVILDAMGLMFLLSGLFFVI